jgi:predicted dehydrogenase
MRTIRWGILGVAKINGRLIPAFKKAIGLELVAIASRDAERAAEAARLDDIPRSFGSYEALLDDPSIDAVYIPLPNHLHAEWTIKAANAGKHVLCEKPIASDAEQARHMVAHCKERNVRLMDGFMWPHHPRTAELRTMIDAKVLGGLKRYTGVFTFPLPLDQPNVRLSPHMAGGSVMDVGCYPVYGARWAFQAEPIRVFATASWFQGVDVIMNGVMEFSGGRVASFDCGFTMPLRMHIELVCDHGTIAVPRMWIPEEEASYIVHREDGVETRHTVPGSDQIVCMLENFSEAVRSGRDATPNPSEAVKNMVVLDALRKSAREGVVVSLFDARHA